jgi:hypothetical protein
MRRPFVIHSPRLLLVFVCALFILAACGGEEAPTATPPSATPTTEPTAVPDPTTTADPTIAPEPTDEPTAVAQPTATTETATSLTAVWPNPIPPYEDLSRATTTTAEQETLATLQQTYPTDRDDLALAIAYRGLTELAPPPPPVTEPLRVGTRLPFTINNTDNNTNSNPIFTLQHVSDHAYFWFDSTPGLTPPDDDELQAMGVGFDDIYEQNTIHFGPESNPGIDGDPRIHIVNASPLSVCAVTEANSHNCGLGGYFGSSDILPQSVDPNSNAKEMFVMNGSFFGSGAYLDILAHEFRHMIESNYDNNDWDWAVEGSAMLAEDLLGYAGDAISRGNQFLSNPDQQLNRWTDGNPTPYYGMGYVINRYIYNRLGDKLHLEFATHPAPGFTALDEIAANNIVDFSSGEELWLDWLAALAIHDHPNAPAKYRIVDGLNTAVATTINKFPTTLDTTVNQYAADYYQLFGSGDATLSFTGSNHAPLLEVLPTSGEHMWLANRANYSTVTLTRPFDLTAVDSATLQYDTFHDIEKGYDFAYASISTDGGQTWQGLTGQQMQGKAPDDDPADVAYTDAFYTGRSDDWVQETIDLTPFVGQEVQIRFEYITDPILTFGGWAIDNIAIPEIGFADDAETDAGWTANGFVRATGYVPQPWHLILITFVDDAPVITPITLNADNTMETTVSLDNAGGERPLLIVAASAPMTLEPATYQLTVDTVE